MKDSNKIYKNKMSMFDLLKGFAIFIVVFWHTYDYWNGNPALIGIQIPLNLIWLGLMPSFLMEQGALHLDLSLAAPTCIQLRAESFVIWVRHGFCLLFVGHA